MLLRAKWLVGACAIWLSACDGGDHPPEKSASKKSDNTVAAAGGKSGASGDAGNSGNAGNTNAGTAGRAARRAPGSCTPQNIEVTCGGKLCPATHKHEKDPCFVPCCVMYEGAEHCGLRGMSAAFSMECVLPAVTDTSCDEVPQFEGCCEPTQGLCGVIGGFAPGCQTTSRFATLPEHPKACTPRLAEDDTDAGL